MAELNFNKRSINYERLTKQKIKFNQGTKDKQIFHYTSILGLKSILENSTLRFTNIGYLNDKDEIKAGLTTLAKLIDSPEGEFMKIEKSLRNIEDQTFVCCFSLDQDSLPMWNYYTKEINNQGYNIEFNDKLLVESILKENECLDGCELSFGVVEYCQDDKSEYSEAFSNELISNFQLATMKLFYSAAKIYSNEALELKKWENEINKMSRDKKDIDIPVYKFDGDECKFKKDTSGNYLCFIKRDCFAPEKELRIVVTVPKSKLKELKDKEIYKYRISNGILIPYLELKFSHNAIKSLTISPTTQIDLAEQSLQDFLKYCEFNVEDYSKFIHKSNIPVRF